MLETWEMLLVGVLVVLVLLWFVPGVKASLKNSPRGSASDWQGVLLPIGLVALFVVLLVALA